MGNAAADRPRVGPSVNRGAKRPAKMDPAKTRCPICGRQRLLQATKLETGEVVRRWHCRCRYVEPESPDDPPLTPREEARGAEAPLRVAERQRHLQSLRERGEARKRERALHREGGAP